MFQKTVDFYIEGKSEVIDSFKSSFLKRPKSACSQQCCKTNYQSPFTDPEFNFISENHLDINSTPFAEFLPDISFAEENSIAQTKLIQYKKHHCQCHLIRLKNQHCYLKNVFPTFHPKFGYVTSVVNQICIKKKCENRKAHFENSKSSPMECRNIRQIILWNESQIDKFFSVQVTSAKLIHTKHLGRISMCINHFSIDDQLFFWKNGFLQEDAELFAKSKINLVTNVALYESNLLPTFELIIQNAGLNFPLNQVPFPLVVGCKSEKVTKSLEYNPQSPESNMSQLVELSIDPEHDIFFPNAELFFSENIDSLLDVSFEIGSPSVSNLTWDQFLSVSNCNSTQNYYYGSYEIVAYLRWHRKSEKIVSYFLDSKNKDKLIDDEIKLFTKFCSDSEGSLLLHAGQQAAWNNQKIILSPLNNVDPHLILLAEILKDFNKSTSPLTSSVDDQNQVLFELTNFIYSTKK